MLPIDFFIRHHAISGGGVTCMDAFKKVVLGAILVFIAAFAFVGYVITDAIESAKIPDDQYGTVTAKGIVTGKEPANYTVTVDENNIIYITSNTTAYEHLEINKTYLFVCHRDVKNAMTVIDSVWQTNRTDT